MWSAVANGVFAWHFTVLDDRQQRAGEIKVSGWRRGGTITIGTTQYPVSRTGWRGACRVEGEGEQILLSAEPQGLSSHTWRIEHDGRAYTLARRSFWGREMVLREDDREVGIIAPEGFRTSRFHITLPDDMPLLPRFFVVWLMMALLKADSDSAVT